MNQHFYLNIRCYDSLAETIFNHRLCNYRQIDIKLLQNFSFIANFYIKGLRPFYIMDLSPSGTGKDVSRRACKELTYLQISEKIEQTERDRWEKHKHQVAEEAKEKNLEKPKFPSKIFRCVHEDLSSPEAIYSSFESIKNQMIEISEVGMGMTRGNKKHN